MGLDTFPRILQPKVTNALTCFGVLFAALVARVYRIESAPDLFVSEPEFANIALQLLKTGQPASFFTHPIGYFISLSAVLFISGRSTVSFDTIFLLRYVDALYGALAVGLIFMWLREDCGNTTAIAAFALLVVEPFTTYYSRFAIIDPQYVFLATFALYFFRKAFSSGKIRDYHIFGMITGFAMITKEVTILIYAVVVVFLFAAGRIEGMLGVSRAKLALAWTKVKHAMIITALVYSAYFEWALQIGRSTFVDEKVYFLERLVLTAPDLSGDIAARANFSADIVREISRYGTTYFLLILSLGSIAYIYLRQRSIPSLLLATWAMVFDVGLAVVLIPRGFSHTPYLTNLIVPAVIVNAVALFWRPTKRLLDKRSTIRFRLSQHQLVKSRVRFIALLLIIFISIQNMDQWYLSYGVANDDARVQTYHWIVDNIPAKSILLLDKSLARMFLFTEQPYRFYSADNFAVVADLFSKRIQFVVYEPRAYIWWSDSLRDYINTKAILLAHFSGYTARDIFIYQLPGHYSAPNLSNALRYTSSTDFATDSQSKLSIVTCPAAASRVRNSLFSSNATIAEANPSASP